MPVRIAHHQSQPHSTTVTSSTNPTTASTAYQMQRPSPASSVASVRDDASTASSVSLESRQRKRIQGESTLLPRSSSLRSPGKVRRSSGARDQVQRKPLLTRTADMSPGKHSTSGGAHGRPDYSLATSASSKFTNNINAHQHGAHEASDPNTTTFYAFPDGTSATQSATLQDPFEFQPSSNLDDVHRGIIAAEHQTACQAPTRKPSTTMRATATMGPPRLPNSSNASTAPGRQPGSLLRRPSVTRHGSKEQVQQVSRLTDRRASSNVSLNASYRKPASTSTVEGDIMSSPVRRKPTVSNTSSLLLPRVGREYHGDGGYSRDSPTDSNGGVVIPAVSRSAKSKSLQPPPRQLHGQSSNQNLNEHHRASVAYPPRSPRSPGYKKTGAPGSSRRISIMPHASGLAARTISPTDARRLKRLSMLKTPPPSHLVATDSRTGLDDPTFPAHMSVTPSSPGTTPDPQRKSYHSGLSGSSNNSSVARSSTLQPKLAHNLGNSRLPRPQLIDRDDEDIPPVPPLPKNIGSPREPPVAESSAAHSSDRPLPGTAKSTNSAHSAPRSASKTPANAEQYGLGLDDTLPASNNLSMHFTPRKSSLPLNLFPQAQSTQVPDLEPVKMSPPKTAPDQEVFNLESFDTKLAEKPHKAFPFPMPRTEPETRRKRGMTLGPGSFGDLDSKQYQSLASKASTSSLKKKDLTLRLPPLNLLPLSTPTIARVNALWPTSDSSEEVTPPPKLGNRTPGTPMTASKATFWSKNDKDDSFSRERSRSSFNQTHAQDDSPSSLSLRAGSSSSSGIPVSNSSRVGRSTNNSPYVPSSLPRNSSTLEDANRKAKSMHSREKSRTRKSQESSRSSVPEDTSESTSTTSAHSIRRRLSLSWKKSSQGKNSHAAVERAGEYEQAKTSKDEPPPPPRMPASSTWTSGANSTPSPNKPLHMAHHDRTKSDPWSSPKKDKKILDKGEALPTKQAAGSSFFPNVQKMLGAKSSVGQLRSRHQLGSLSADPTLDNDDLVAEEEMRKLASKRKNLDQAAAQLDELKRRALPKERMSPQTAIRAGGLNIFERGEIVDFREQGVYFTGLPDARKHVGDLTPTAAPNFGYDDERGDYAIIKGDHLQYRYEIIDVLGKGSFGQVVRCIDHKTGGLVAVKIIRNKKRFHQQALVEVNILQRLKQWDPQGKHSLINFTDSFHFRGHLCISTELLGMNLYEFIKSNDFKGFSLKMIRRFTKQMLSCLVLLKGKRVIHCDLKPENILLAHPAHTEIKVIDFGSSCFENEKVYTYIQSRFYRSPEVILGMSYGLPIDMWSLGCILAELKTGYPIFPGENEQEQLACIMEVFGPPEKHLIEKSTRRKLFFDSQGKPRMTVSSKGRRRRPSSKTIQSALKCDDDAFVDFVSRCLRWDPEKRMKPDEAVHHEFITGRKASRIRSGNYASSTAASDSKERRYTAYSRPLPDPPSYKKSLAMHASSSGTSPLKPPSSSGNGSNNGTSLTSTHSFRRDTNATSNKRNSIGAALGSALPRVQGVKVGQRSVSGKPSFTGGQTMQERRELRHQREAEAAANAAAAAAAITAAQVGNAGATGTTGKRATSSIRMVRDE
ncbi:hypothetical protein EX30DRAFT_348499 [Ascodesmis nigricans]|uniref:Protein kinase domain-containing protein n=1 Tax=Ascodesmis nigricans TaxID=341454 RepID=A0A4S2MYK5_9PEZI|nr:hypothetical protein EX30DRAFT_348499 [Ascodesmis nigricans]